MFQRRQKKDINALAIVLLGIGEWALCSKPGRESRRYEPTGHPDDLGRKRQINLSQREPQEWSFWRCWHFVWVTYTLTLTKMMLSGDVVSEALERMQCEG